MTWAADELASGCTCGDCGPACANRWFKPCCGACCAPAEKEPQ